MANFCNCIFINKKAYNALTTETPNTSNIEKRKENKKKRERGDEK